MAHALTETNTFTANVVVPDPADARTAASVETPFQALANRTKHLNERTAGLALSAANYGVGGTLKAINDKLDLSGSALGSDFALSGGNTVVFATAGTYFVHWHAVLQAGDTANPSEVGAYLDLDGTPLQIATEDRNSNDPDHNVCVGAGYALVVTVGQGLSLKAATSLTAGTHVATGTLAIVRLK